MVLQCGRGRSRSRRGCRPQWQWQGACALRQQLDQTTLEQSCDSARTESNVTCTTSKKAFCQHGHQACVYVRHEGEKGFEIRSGSIRATLRCFPSKARWKSATLGCVGPGLVLVQATNERLSRASPRCKSVAYQPMLRIERPAKQLLSAASPNHRKLHSEEVSTWSKPCACRFLTRCSLLVSTMRRRV